ncbi:hypothetical protein WKI45_18000 [Delftia tsuruhatensis]
MHNTLTAAELKRRGMAAIEDGLRHGPVHLIKRNQATAVVLSEQEYRKLLEQSPQPHNGMTAVQWLLSQPTTGAREKAEIDAFLSGERDW